MIQLCFAIRLPADDHWVYDCAQLPAMLSTGSFDGSGVRRESDKCRIDLVSSWAGNEDEVGMRRRIAEAGRGARCIDQDRAPITWLWRDECLLEGPELSLQCQILSLAPKLLEYSGEFLGHFVTIIVLDVPAAEHLGLTRRIAGDDVDTPTPTRDMVDRSPELSKMEGMPWTEEHMNC